MENRSGDNVYEKLDKTIKNIAVHGTTFKVNMTFAFFFKKNHQNMT